ncbi:MAG: hypothetical protein HY823_13340 [Acidobacteria bacterium]|nr:hypothetical protein [Acidobacteriota bacterium]
MKPRGKLFLWTGVVLGLGFWVIEALLHTYVFHQHPLQEELFPFGDPNEMWMRIMIAVGFVVFGVVTQRLHDRIAGEKARIDRINADLVQAMTEIRTLTGILPVCAQCKKIRDGPGSWQRMEAYLADHAGVGFTHGLCPECEAAFRAEFRQEGR